MSVAKFIQSCQDASASASKRRAASIWVDRQGVSGTEVDQGFERAHRGGALENFRDLCLETSDLIDMARQRDQQTGPSRNRRDASHAAGATNSGSCVSVMLADVALDSAQVCIASTACGSGLPSAAVVSVSSV